MEGEYGYGRGDEMGGGVDEWWRWRVNRSVCI